MSTKSGVTLPDDNYKMVMSGHSGNSEHMVHSTNLKSSGHCKTILCCIPFSL